MSAKHTMDSVIKELDKVEVGMLDSLKGRSRLYLLAVIADHRNSIDSLTEKLEFETKVNNRVNEIFKGWFHREG